MNVDLSEAEQGVAIIHAIDRHTQEHLCGTPDGVGTDALAPAMRITCPECVEAGDAFREGDCWLCTHRVLGSLCGRCGCLAHYPPWPDVAAPHSDPSAAS